MTHLLRIQLRDEASAPVRPFVAVPHPYFERHLDAYLGETIRQIEAAGWSIDVARGDR